MGCGNSKNVDALATETPDDNSNAVVMQKVVEGDVGDEARRTELAEKNEVKGDTIELVSLETKPDFKDAKSLTAKHLTDEVWEACKDKKTAGGFGFDYVINSGFQNLDSGVGCYAPDEDAYKTFAPFFDKVIDTYHGGYAPDAKHTTDLNMDNFKGGNVDPDNNYVVSTRIRVGRNLDGYPLAPGISKSQRLEVENKIVEALKTLEGDLKGEYYPLQGMEEDVQKRLIEDHFLFKEGDRFLRAAGANRDWPEGRGIFHSGDKRFLVWVNEEDQLRIISMQMGGDVKEVFARLATAIQTMEKKLTFAANDHLGCISSCPTNLGTAMRASVHVKIPHASKEENFKTWCAERSLSVRGIHGEHSESEGGVYDISNKRRLGLSEVECVQTMYDGVAALIAWEKELEAKAAAPAEEVVQQEAPAEESAPAEEQAEEKAEEATEEKAEEEAAPAEEQAEEAAEEKAEEESAPAEEAAPAEEEAAPAEEAA